MTEKAMQERCDEIMMRLRQALLLTAVVNADQMRFENQETKIYAITSSLITAAVGFAVANGQKEELYELLREALKVFEYKSPVMPIHPTPQ